MINIENAHLEQVLRFVIEIDKLKNVARKVKPVGQDRYENSAEHTWQITVHALILSKYCPKELDVFRVIKMLLIHDIGEIDTGDTMVFVEGGWVERKRDEFMAIQRIFGLLPEAIGAEFLALWQEFEKGETMESRFANALDRAMPVLLNLENEGQSWRENKISFERVVNRIEGQINDGFPALWAYLRPKLDEARGKGYFHGE
jgi:putative hydrolase of HD superfamily